MYAYIDDGGAARAARDGDVKDVPKQLVDLANAGGGHDNITAVVIRVGETAAAELAAARDELALKLDVLKGMQMFRYLSYKELVQVAAIAETIEVTRPTRRSSATAQPGDAMYVVLVGQRAAARRTTTSHRRSAAASTSARWRSSIARCARSTAIAGRADSARRRSAQRLLRHHQARAGERGEAVVGVRAGARSRCARRRAISATRCTATSRRRDRAGELYFKIDGAARGGAAAPPGPARSR